DDSQRPVRPLPSRRARSDHGGGGPRLRVVQVVWLQCLPPGRQRGRQSVSEVRDLCRSVCGGGGSRRADLGRFAITGRESDRRVFRVPSLRNVAVTAPYFHDGRTASLNDAVRIMARSQLGRELTEREIRAIVKFLRTLTGEYRGRPLDRLAEGQAR